MRIAEDVLLLERVMLGDVVVVGRLTFTLTDVKEAKPVPDDSSPFMLLERLRGNVKYEERLLPPICELDEPTSLDVVVRGWLVRLRIISHDIVESAPQPRAR